MTLVINRTYLPIKAHYFLFFAALGPILPQLNVFGRQLGVSPGVMGMVTGVLPLLWAAAKPSFGLLVDYFTSQRKVIFMSLIAVMTISHCCLWFLPTPTKSTEPILEHVRLNATVAVKQIMAEDRDLIKFNCHWDTGRDFELWLTDDKYISTLYVNKFTSTCEDLNMILYGTAPFLVCEPKNDSYLVCKEDNLNIDNELINSLIKTQIVDNTSKINNTNVSQRINEIEAKKHSQNSNNIMNKTLSANNPNLIKNVEGTLDTNFNNDKRNNINDLESVDRFKEKSDSNITKKHSMEEYNATKDEINSTYVEEDKIYKIINGQIKDMDGNDEGSFYTSYTFWFYVIFMCVGAVSFNVANCIADAVCFNVLGPENGNKYGHQRTWGTAGYGITALVGGWLIDMASGGNGDIKIFTPAFILSIVFTIFDIVACRSLKLPKLSSPSDSGKALKQILKMPRVLVFICFAMIIGIFDSFIIYYMFWYLEELAETTGHMPSIKLIEGAIVAAQSFGELFFFFYSGRILKRWGHGITMTFCLFCYGVRLALISFISHPWHFVFIEILMQGPTYALCYATIVGYAAEVAPEGYSATVQGIVAGMDDGIGFSLGSLLGGFLYSYLGGTNSFRLMSLIGLLASFVHALMYKIMEHKPVEDISLEDKLNTPEVEKMLEDNHELIYKNTVMPLK